MNEDVLKELLIGQELNNVEKALARLPEFSEAGKTLAAVRAQFIDRIENAFVFSLSLAYRPSVGAELSGWSETYLICCYLRERRIRDVRTLNLSDVIALKQAQTS